MKHGEEDHGYDRVEKMATTDHTYKIVELVGSSQEGGCSRRLRRH